MAKNKQCPKCEESGKPTSLLKNVYYREYSPKKTNIAIPHLLYCPQCQTEFRKKTEET